MPPSPRLPPAPATDPASIDALSAWLLAASSSTRVLQAWCDRFGIGEAGEPVIAHCLPQPAGVPPEDWVLDTLRPVRGEAVRLRRVRLMRGGLVLSRAENWYRPDRLSPTMRMMLETTQVPFGVVVEPLGPARRTIDVAFHRLGEDCALEHRALVADADGTPLALVREAYRRVLLRPEA